MRRPADWFWGSIGIFLIVVLIVGGAWFLFFRDPYRGALIDYGRFPKAQPALMIEGPSGAIILKVPLAVIESGERQDFPDFINSMDRYALEVIGEGEEWFYYYFVSQDDRVVVTQRCYARGIIAEVPYEDRLCQIANFLVPVPVSQLYDLGFVSALEETQ